MGEQYEPFVEVRPVNPDRPVTLVHLCRTCGALVANMGRHDGHHARERSAGVIDPR